MNKLIIASLSIALLSGCSTLKRATGQIDDSVLPGQRQEVLSPDQQQARDPSITGQPAPPSTQPPNPQIAAAQPSRALPQSNAAAPLAPPSDAAAIAACDPKVDLCPEAVAPEPLPPPSPLIPEKKTKMAANGKGVATSIGASKTADAKKLLKKKLHKKKPAKVVAKLPSAPAATDATPPVAEPPKPQSQ